jgi:hypothetical protein
MQPLRGPAARERWGSRWRDGGLHRLGGLEDERELHLAGAEQLADDLHAVEEDVVDDVEGRVGLQRLVEEQLHADACCRRRCAA